MVYGFAAAGFLMAALIFSMERIGKEGITRVNVDRRILMALLAGASFAFLTTSPTSPYRDPFDVPTKTELAQIEITDLVTDDAAVMASPSVTGLLGDRAELYELPSDPESITLLLLQKINRNKPDAIVIDTNSRGGFVDNEPWSYRQRIRIETRIKGLSFNLVKRSNGVLLFEK